MKKYFVSKKKAAVFICTILFIITFVVCFLIFIKANLSAVLFTGLVIIFPFIFAFVHFLPDIQNTITIEEEGFKFKKKGQRERNIHWDNIQSIQFSGIPWLPISRIMIVNIACNSKFPETKIYIDYMYHDYKKLWKEITQGYKALPQALVDQRLLQIINK